MTSRTASYRTRQVYALAHPLNGTEQSTEPYNAVDPQPDGNLLLSILAVDR